MKDLNFIANNKINMQMKNNIFLADILTNNKEWSSRIYVCTSKQYYTYGSNSSTKPPFQLPSLPSHHPIFLFLYIIFDLNYFHLGRLNSIITIHTIKFTLHCSTERMWKWKFTARINNIRSEKKTIEFKSMRWIEVIDGRVVGIPMVNGVLVSSYLYIYCLVLPHTGCV